MCIHSKGLKEKRPSLSGICSLVHSGPNCIFSCILLAIFLFYTPFSGKFGLLFPLNLAMHCIASLCVITYSECFNLQSLPILYLLGKFPMGASAALLPMCPSPG